MQDCKIVSINRTQGATTIRYRIYAGRAIANDKKARSKNGFERTAIIREGTYSVGGVLSDEEIASVLASV